MQSLLSTSKNEQWQKRSIVLQSFLENKLVIPTLNFIHIIDINKILYIQSSSNYTKFFLEDNSTILCSKTLKLFEGILIDKHFLRIHSSYIINLNKLIGIKRNGDYTVVLENDIRLPVSRSYKNMLFTVIY